MSSADICPTITVDNEQAYARQIEKIVDFAVRIHIDISDGVFSPVRLIPIDQIWWPGGVRADLHVMYKKPFEFVDTYLGLEPQMVIVHAEAEGDFVSFSELLHHHGIEVGVALLPETPAETLSPALQHIDHVLIFSGDLGHYGGHANLDLLSKVKVLRDLKPQLEIGWDGGINDENAGRLVKGGIDVLNVGGFIANADSANDAYAKLRSVIDH
jgi:ribulose-phosphate 3-epimerase